MLSAIVAPVFACTNQQNAKVDLTGVWAFNYVVGGVYPHTMIISSFNRVLELSQEQVTIMLTQLMHGHNRNRIGIPLRIHSYFI